MWDVGFKLVMSNLVIWILKFGFWNLALRLGSGVRLGSAKLTSHRSPTFTSHR
jgi:hypothetical protein